MAERGSPQGKALTKLILVRHGHFEGTKPACFRCGAKIPLTTLGRPQADATARRNCRRVGGLCDLHE
jgi:broad specificity phosphatase PhoE